MPGNRGATAFEGYVLKALVLGTMIPKNLDLWDFSEDRHALILDEVRAGEQVTWVGTPHPLRYGLLALPVFVSGLVIAGFSAFILAGVFDFQWPDPVWKFEPLAWGGLAGMLLGLGMMLWPLWLVFKAARTIYVITNQRAIIFDGGLFATVVRSFEADRLRDLRRRQYRDGSGDVIFDKACDQIETTGPADSTAGFYAVADVRSVERAVRRLTAPEPPKKLEALRQRF